MRKYREILLQTLLDKYEHSLVYRGENQVNVTISFRFNKKNIPEYYDAFNYKYKEDINDVVKNLEEKKYIVIIWEKYEEGNLVKKINLNIDKVEDIYNLLNRIEKKAFEEEAIHILKQYEHHVSYLGTFVKDMIVQLQTGNSISKYLDITNPKLIKDILFALDKILIQDVEISKRVLSIQLFNDSKYLESIESKIIKIMKDYGDYIDDKHILSEENIVRNPGYIYLKGKGKFKIGEQIIDLSLVDGEIALSSRCVSKFEIISLDVKKVITIENLTSFHYYNVDNELIIYLGGFHNQLRENFLIKIFNYDQSNLFYHWSDIDLGGFRIFHHLKVKTNIPFIPYLMDKDTLIKYEKYSMPIKSKTYLATLTEMINSEAFKPFNEVISYMIKKEIRLEQETMLIENI